MLKLSRDLGIDLGTANVLVYAEGQGIVLREPSVVAIDKVSGKVLQVGAAARNMLGRTPGNVVAVRPLRQGVISDYEMKIYCKISCIFYKCIAFSGIRFIHFVRTHSSRLRSAHQSASAAKNAAAHALRKHAQRRKGIQVQRSRFPAHKAVKGGGTDHSGIVCTQGHRR